MMLSAEVLLACVLIPAAAAAVFDDRLPALTPLLRALRVPLPRDVTELGYTAVFALCVLWCAVNLGRNLYECLPRAYARQRRLSRDPAHDVDDDDDDDDDDDEDEEKPSRSEGDAERQPLTGAAAGGAPPNYHSIDPEAAPGGGARVRKAKSGAYVRAYILFVLVRLTHSVCLALFVWLCYQRSRQTAGPRAAAAPLSFWVILSPLFVSLACAMAVSVLNHHLARRRQARDAAAEEATLAQLLFFCSPQLCVLYMLAFWAAKLQDVVNRGAPNFPLFYYHSAPSAFTASLPFLFLLGLAVLVFFIAFVASLCVTKETIEDTFRHGAGGGDDGDPLGDGHGRRGSDRRYPPHSHQHPPAADDYSGRGVSTYGSVFTSGTSTPVVPSIEVDGSRVSSRTSSRSQGQRAPQQETAENID
ncbi:heat shock protein [Strigomonas culicis]|uniref:Heat shock protein n=1 Tax=Strigomonas culicis TaxID=28005 RepID=S9TBB1_9TRYP|nr:heat shock protein [Strigomonas culicis]|eukprot:EPY15297.1 heat shock protein [Strigomonas culicis]